jgi:hypothetical protein
VDKNKEAMLFISANGMPTKAGAVKLKIYNGATFIVKNRLQ